MSKLANAKTPDGDSVLFRMIRGGPPRNGAATKADLAAQKKKRDKNIAERDANKQKPKKINTLMSREGKLG